MYKCIKAFYVPMCDDNGFTLENKKFFIEKGTTWNLPEDDNYRFVGGEIRLESNSGWWVEISKEDFNEFFELVKKED